MVDQAELRFLAEAGRLALAYRERCLWFLREDFLPETVESGLRILSYIEKYGDRAAFEEASRIRKWLSLHSNVTSAQ